MPGSIKEQLFKQFDHLVEVIETVAYAETWALADWLTGEHVWNGGSGSMDHGEKVTIKELANRSGYSSQFLYTLRKAAAAFPPGERVANASPTAHINALRKGGSRAEVKRAIQMANDALKASQQEARNNATYGHAKKAIKDPARRAKVIEALAEEDPDALKEFVLEALKGSDSTTQQDVLRSMLEWSAQQDSDNGEDNSEDEEEDEEEQDSEEEDDDAGTSSTSTGKKSKAKESQETKDKRKERQKSKAKNQTDDKTKEDVRNEQLRSLLMFAVRGHGGLLAAAGWLDAITHVKWLSRDEYDCFMPLMAEVPRLAEQVREWGDSLDVLPDLPDDAVTLDNELSEFLKEQL